MDENTTYNYHQHLRQLQNENEEQRKRIVELEALVTWMVSWKKDDENSDTFVAEAEKVLAKK